MVIGEDLEVIIMYYFIPAMIENREIDEKNVADSLD